MHTALHTVATLFNNHPYKSSSKFSANWHTLLPSNSIEVANTEFIGTFTKAQLAYVIRALAMAKIDGKTLFGL